MNINRHQSLVIASHLLLTAILCFIFAGAPFWLMSDGYGFQAHARAALTAVGDAWRTTPTLAVSTFFIPVLCGITTSAVVVQAFAARLSSSLRSTVSVLTIGFTVLVIVASIMLPGVHMMTLALVPLGFAFFTARKAQASKEQ